MQALSPRPDVSVVIATYNMGRYLPEALQSVLNQSVGTVEVHVVDDGSTDDTRAVLEPFLVDPRVYYHYQANAGQTKAKNVGVRAARGRYIAFCDADDLWTSDKLAGQLPVLEQHSDVAVAYARIQPIDAHGNWLPPVRFPEPSGKVTEALFAENFIPFGSTLVRAAALQSVGGFDESRRMGIDWDLWLRLSVDYRFIHVPQVNYLYRVWEGQMSRNWQGRYDSAFKIMGDFERAHPSLISKATHRLAYRDSYLNRAGARARLSNDRAGALVDAFQAVRIDPRATWPAVRILGKLLLQHPYR